MVDEARAAEIAAAQVARATAAEAVMRDAAGVSVCDPLHMPAAIAAGEIGLCAVHPDAVRCLVCHELHRAVHDVDCDACGLRATATTQAPHITLDGGVFVYVVDNLANWCDSEPCFEHVQRAGQIAGMQLWFDLPSDGDGDAPTER